MIKSVLNRYKSFPIQVKASLWFLICSFLQKGISTVTTPIFTRIMNTTEYGQYNVFNSWLSIASIFVSLSLTGGVYAQGLVKFEKDRNVFTSSLQGLTLLLVAVWMVIYFIFHDFWNQLFTLSSVQMIAMLVIIWTTAVFSFWSTEQRVNYKYKALVVITLVVSLAKPMVGIFCVSVTNDKVSARILGIALVELIGYAWLFFIQVKRGEVLFSKKYWVYALSFNLPLVPHYLSQTVLNSADRIMIRDLVGPSDEGIYSLAYSISLLMLLFNTALMQTINPWIYRKIKDKSIKDISSVAYSTLMALACLNLLLIVLAPEVVAIFAPPTYYDAIYVIPPVAMSGYFMYMYDLFAKFAFYYEKTKFVMIASVTGAILNIILNFIFIRLFGYRAAGYTTLACYMIYSISHYIFMNKVCDQFCDGVRPYEQKKLLMITVPFLLAGFAILGTYRYPVIRYGILAVALVLVLLEKNCLISVLKDLLAKKKA